MKTVENLENNECLLVSARKVNGGKVQLTFAQKIQNPNARPANNNTIPPTAPIIIGSSLLLFFSSFSSSAIVYFLIKIIS